MRTEVIQLKDGVNSSDAVRRAADLIRSGGLVAFPTETVYGLGANVADRAAMGRLRAVKGRSDKKPFTVHVAAPGDVHRFVPSMSAIGRRLSSKGWPGPLTLVFPVPSPESASVMKELSADQANDIYCECSVGIRCPDHPVASALLSLAGVPVVAASANLAGNPPPVNAGEVLSDLDGKIDLLLDGGRVRYAKPSTIVRLNGDGYEILREGVWDERIIRRLATTRFLFVCTGNTCRSPMAEGLCRQMLAERLGCRVEDLAGLGYEVQSAGVYAMSGTGAQESALRVLARRGIDISRHVSRPLTVELVHQADYIYAMTGSHLESVLSMVPGSVDRVAMLQEGCDIEDPLGSGDDVYQECADRISEAIRHRLAEIPI